MAVVNWQCYKLENELQMLNNVDQANLVLACGRIKYFKKASYFSAHQWPLIWRFIVRYSWPPFLPSFSLSRYLALLLALYLLFALSLTCSLALLLTHSLALSLALHHHLCFSATCVNEPFISGWEEEKKISVDLSSEGESHLSWKRKKVFLPKTLRSSNSFFLLFFLSRGQRKL